MRLFLDGGRLNYHGCMVEKRADPLLAAGNEDDWARINAEEEAEDAAAARTLGPAERLSIGQRLSQQAVSLLAASIKAGNAPRRAYWS